MKDHALHILSHVWETPPRYEPKDVHKVAFCSSQEVSDHFQALGCQVLRSDEELISELFKFSIKQPIMLVDAHRWVSLKTYDHGVSRALTQHQAFNFFKELARFPRPLAYRMIHHQDDLDATLFTGIALSLALEKEAFSAHSCITGDLTYLELDQITGANHPYLRMQAGKLERLTLQSLKLTPPQPMLSSGRYVITGNGGVSRLLARYLKETYGAQVTLMGRRSLDSEEETTLKQIGVETYLSLDMGNLEKLQKAWDFLTEMGSPIKGVFHLAGVIEDALWINKTQQSFDRVLYPKTQCLENLDAVIGNSPLDVFVCFSSLTGLLGNTGQTDYAAANAWMRSFCERRHQQVISGERQGQTLAIDWGLWKDGGMSAEIPKLSSLKTDEAFQAMERLLQTNLPVGSVFKGAYSILGSLGSQKLPTLETHSDVATKTLMEKITEIVKEVTKLYQIKPDDSLLQQGVDSVAAITLANRLNQSFQTQVSQTLLFEYPTIQDLVAYFETLLPKPLKTENKHGTIAVVGMAARFPKSEKLTDFWKNLMEGKDCVGDIPQKRWQMATIPKDFPVKKGGFLDDIFDFDPLFFNIAPSQAESMDPQERLLLQNVYHAFEDACLLPEQHPQTGVFVAAMFGHYTAALKGEDVVDYSLASLANRISFALNFQGPSMGLDSMCSGSLTALHLACQSLKLKECDLAVVAGVNLMPHPAKYRFLAQGHFLSQQGRCHSFGEKADGYIPAEGVGVVLLKRALEAQEHGDRIHGVILGSAINAGGRSAGYTVPQPAAQRAVVTRALHQAQIKPEMISYIEAHGTGTKLGDPIEIEGLTAALKGLQTCGLGSVKSNLGHLESAAGMAGFIKVMLQLRHATLVPTLHSTPANPLLNLEKTPFFLVDHCQPWKSSEVRRAGISAFGAGGSNAHVVVEEAPQSPHMLPTAPLYLLPLSAKSENAFHKLIESLKQWLPYNTIDAYSLAYGYACGRQHFDYRLAILFKDVQELIQKLQKPITPEKTSPIHDAFDLGWLSSGAFETIASFYQKGGEIPWEALYPTRVVTSLPLYPFEKITCIAPVFKQALKAYTAPDEVQQSPSLLPYHFFVKERVSSPLPSQNSSKQIHIYRLTDFNIPKPIEDQSVVHLEVPSSMEQQEVCRLLYNLGQSLINVRFDHYLVLSINTSHPILKGASGFFKSLCLENSHLLIKWIELDQEMDMTSEFPIFSTRFESIVYEKNQRFVQQEKAVSLQASRNHFQKGGVYIITGGMGKIAQHLAIHLLKTYQAQIYLLGRSELTHERRMWLRGLDRYGGHAAYYVCDVASQPSVSETLSLISRLEKGSVNGVIHTAGILKDGLFQHKTFEDFWDVISVKAQSALWINEALKEHDLDFMAFFSSIASAYGNVGQTDYALANGILDYLSHHDCEKIFSIQWPLWEDTGMGISDHQIQHMKDHQGLEPLKIEEGLQLFEQILGQKEHRVILPLKGDLGKIQTVRESLFQREIFTGEELPKQDLTVLKEIVHNITRVPLDRIDLKTPFGDYGFDSISLTKFSEKIQSYYGISLPPSAFFSINTLSKLEQHLETQQAKSPVQKQAAIIERRTTDTPRYGIIGMDARMPGASTLEAFWEHMKQGLNPVVPMMRWQDPNCFGALVPHIDQFDPTFFGLSGLEAMLMDPQHRLFLETATRAVLDGGYDPHTLKRVGVFAGVQFNDYQGMLQQHGQSRHPYAATGNAHTMLVNRLSYLYDWEGPSQSMDTACSSSLIALRRGLLALERGECDFALVGGVSLLIDREVTEAAKSMGVLSPKFRCATFDASADGYVRGEGVGCVFLKRYEDVVRDRDPCHGLILSAVENHGGRAHSLTAPSTEAQKNLLLQAYHDRDLAAQVTAIEAHGTGTKLGDPIEVDALKAAWRDMGLSQDIALSSVKTHIGHLEPAAGMASLIKMLLCLKHQTLIGNLHFQKLNPYIELDHFRVLQENEPWESQGPRTAGISSFGFGGSNAHITLQEAPVREAPQLPLFPAVLICLSAKHPESLKQMLNNLATFLEQGPPPSLPEIAYTLQMGRGHFDHRWAAVVKTQEDLIVALRQSVEIRKIAEKDLKQLEIPSPDGRAYAQALEDWKIHYLEGYTLPWRNLYHGIPIPKAHLPTYAFQPQSYWLKKQDPLLQEVNYGT